MLYVLGREIRYMRTSSDRKPRNEKCWVAFDRQVAEESGATDGQYERAFELPNYNIPAAVYSRG